MTMPFKWEFPGGKINPGETAEECIMREINEELGIAIPNPYQAGCGGGTHHGAPDGKLTCPLCRMRKESNWPKNMNSRSSNDPAVSARGSRLAWNSRRAPDPDMDVPAEDFLFVHTQPLFIIAI